jgi:hypothetical protein
VAVRKLSLLASLVLLAGCSKKPPSEERTEPWLASPPEAKAAVRAKYRVGERCEAKLELRAKEATPRGRLRVCRGELDLNLTDLADSRGTLAIDVASVEMAGDGDGGRSDERTQEAQNWLDVGASRPEAEREKHRWATFTLTGAKDASSATAHAGRREKVVREPEEAEALPEEDGGGSEEKRERRSVSLTARGQLVLHRVRVELEVPVRVTFEYGGAAAPEALPARVEVSTRRPVVISLATHDIKPRDASGVFQAQGMKLLGKQVGRDARVTLSATAALLPP